MLGRLRRNHSSVFESKVALAAVMGDKTISELFQQFDIHPSQITRWKTQLLERMIVVFEVSGQVESPAVDIKTLHAKIGELPLENDFIEIALTRAGMLSAKR